MRGKLARVALPLRAPVNVDAGRSPGLQRSANARPSRFAQWLDRERPRSAHSCGGSAGTSPASLFTRPRRAPASAKACQLCRAQSMNGACECSKGRPRSVSAFARRRAIASSIRWGRRPRLLPACSPREGISARIRISAFAEDLQTRLHGGDLGLLARNDFLCKAPELMPALECRFGLSATRRDPARRRSLRGSPLGGRAFVGVGDHAQAGRPKAVQPALALVDLGLQPDRVVIHALLRAKAFERSTVPHQAELAVAVSAMVFHGFLPAGVRL